MAIIDAATFQPDWEHLECIFRTEDWPAVVSVSTMSTLLIACTVE
ncbi:hypothetical protein [uncultured Corynebacterium sp.]|nr:hypothetical protein [uncultured Corynebacterium sp.]